MPRSFLLQAGVNPEKDFKRVAFSGAHDATIAAVASGKVQGGALNISVWEKFVADKKVDTAKVRVIFTTPPYYDYNWSVHADMPAGQREKLAAALLKRKGHDVLVIERQHFPLGQQIITQIQRGQHCRLFGIQLPAAFFHRRNLLIQQHCSFF